MNAYIIRKPFFGRDNMVCTYDILYRDNRSEEEIARAAEDDSPSFFGLRLMNITGGAPAAIRFDAQMLKNGLVESMSAADVVVIVDDEIICDDELFAIARSLKEKGYRLAYDRFRAGREKSRVFALCDMARVSFRVADDETERAVKAALSCGKTVAATDIDDYTTLEYAREIGCEATGGRYFTKPIPGQEDNVHPLPLNFMQIMRLVSQAEPEFKDIVEVISRDTAMCQRLLKLINSVYFGVRNRVSSINQALVILGLDYLREWVYLMGMQRITHNDNVELMRESVLMAKFCRQLSLLIPDAARQSEAFYLMGLLSMVTYSGDRALSIALEDFPVTDDIKSGLLRRGGLYSDVYDMAYRYERGDWSAADEFSAKYGISASKLSDVYIHCVMEAERIKLL
ncbi:MAG: EAL and HDOD domain-containing protein [Oscillospiraceae bacterium]